MLKCCLGLFTLVAVFAPAIDATQDAGPTTVFLVRHAEKAAQPVDDPPLTAAGRERTEELVRTLAEAGVTAIYSSQYQRTRLTVEPLARALGLEVVELPGGDFERLARRIKSRDAGGVVVVAGHSNTVPEIIAALGAGHVTPIDDDEHDNLYVVTIETSGSARVSTLKYGAPS